MSLLETHGSAEQTQAIQNIQGIIKRLDCRWSTAHERINPGYGGWYLFIEIDTRSELTETLRAFKQKGIFSDDIFVDIPDATRTLTTILLNPKYFKLT